MGVKATPLIDDRTGNKDVYAPDPDTDNDAQDVEAAEQALLNRKVNRFGDDEIEGSLDITKDSGGLGGNLGVEGDASVGGDIAAGGSIEVGGVATVGEDVLVSGSKVTVVGPQPVLLETPAANTLYSTNIPKAWARIKCTGVSVSIDDGFNVGGVLFTGGGTGVSVSFLVPFSSDEYAPLVSFQGQMGVPRVTVITASVLVIEHYNITAAALFDLSSTAVVFTLAVFGRQ